MYRRPCSQDDQYRILTLDFLSWQISLLWRPFADMNRLLYILKLFFSPPSSTGELPSSNLEIFILSIFLYHKTVHCPSPLIQFQPLSSWETYPYQYILTGSFFDVVFYEKLPTGILLYQFVLILASFSFWGGGGMYHFLTVSSSCGVRLRVVSAGIYILPTAHTLF